MYCFDISNDLSGSADVNWFEFMCAPWRQGKCIHCMVKTLAARTTASRRNDWVVASVDKNQARVGPISGQDQGFLWSTESSPELAWLGSLLEQLNRNDYSPYSRLMVIWFRGSFTQPCCFNTHRPTPRQGFVPDCKRFVQQCTETLWGFERASATIIYQQPIRPIEAGNVSFR